MSRGLYSEEWGTQEQWPKFQRSRPRASSLIERPFPARRIDEVMAEFKVNGIDSPYEPDEEANKQSENTGLAIWAPSSTYLRQRSWPAPDASPATPLPVPRASDYGAPNIEDYVAPAPNVPAYVENPLPPGPTGLTEEQVRALHSLPNVVIHQLLRELERDCKRPKAPEIECRFCKNNGEKESFYRSHRLRWNGCVLCPVLRAYTCRRCGARGDNAHTLKYCPLTTDDERLKSTNMMRNIRQGSNRRRSWVAPSNEFSGNYGAMNRNMMTDGVPYNMYEPLDPTWEALAHKLMT